MCRWINDRRGGLHIRIPAIFSQLDIWQTVEIAHVRKHNWQIARLLDDTVDYLAMHGLEPYGLGNGPVGVKVDV